MRIIAGKYRRRKLLASPGQVTRPITDRVKEVLFERIEQEFPDSRVADIFSGTGSLGLEALSRGARSVVFVENDRQAYHLLQENVAKIGVEDETLCWRTDVLRCSFRPKGDRRLFPYDVVFFDPPYRMLPHIKPLTPMYKALLRLARDEVTTDDALLLVRTPAKVQLECPDVWAPDQIITSGGMEIHLFDKQKAETA